MVIKNVKRHGQLNYTYSGEIDRTKVIVVFENGLTPVQGDIDVTLGKMVTKNGQNFYYVRGYKTSGPEKPRSNFYGDFH